MILATGFGSGSRRPSHAMRLACPSWVMPGTWAENLDFILSRPEKPVQGVELLVFDFDRDTRDALARDLPAIARAGRELELSVHLPSRVGPGALELVEMLKPYAGTFVAHPPKRGDEADFSSFMRAVTDACADFPGKTMPVAGPRAGASLASGQVFALEYTNGEDFARGLDLLDAAGIPSSTFPLCMDTGHLLLEGKDPADFAFRAGERLVRIHLHDVTAHRESGKTGRYSGDNSTVSDGRKRDHAALVPGSAWLARLFPLLVAFDGFVELEMFDWGAVVASATLLRTMETAANISTSDAESDPAGDPASSFR